MCIQAKSQPCIFVDVRGGHCSQLPQKMIQKLSLLFHFRLSEKNALCYGDTKIWWLQLHGSVIFVSKLRTCGDESTSFWQKSLLLSYLSFKVKMITKTAKLYHVVYWGFTLANLLISYASKTWLFQMTSKQVNIITA